MRIGDRAAVRAIRPRAAGRGGASARRVAARVALIALATAAAVFIAGGGDAFWLCVPASLVACASSATRLGAALSTAAVLAGAAAPAFDSARVSPVASPVLALIVVIASVSVLVTVRERVERERDAMRDFALNDPLTRIANRRSLLWRADYEIARHSRARRRFALVMLDLDGFKLLNDRFGHAAGDDLLRDVAMALKRAMRAQDTVARLGGDEFCVLAPETEAPGTHRLAARIAQALSEVTAGVEVVNASIGIAVFPDDGVTAAALLLAADQRMMSAKRTPDRAGVRPRAA